MKQILIYSGIWSFTAEDFINRLDEIGVDEDLTVRLNSPGGSPFAGWGMIAALRERRGKTFLKIDGNAASMAFFMIPFFQHREALDVTSFTVHRATAWIVNEDDQKRLDNINTDLRKAFEAIIDKKKFKKITGVSVKQIFEDEIRRDVHLTAKEAKEVGLINSIRRLKPEEIAAYNENFISFSNLDSPQGSGEKSQGSDRKEEKEIINIKTEKKMTIAELKEKYPELYASIVVLGVSQEKDRVQAWLAFSDVDLEAVSKGIDAGDLVSQKVIAEMSRKAMSAEFLKKTEKESPDAIDTSVKEDEVLSEKEKEYAEVEKDVFEAAGLKIEKIKKDG